MSIGTKIAHYRKKLNITQDALAQKLEVTNQAVSKWESDQCCPDIGLLPRLADIFGISIDELFDRQPQAAPAPAELPWADDDTLRVVVYQGHTLVGGSAAINDLTFQYEGPALNVHSEINIQCGDVAGNVEAKGSVTCDDVGGDVHANGSVTCDNVAGSINAGGNVSCDDVEGDVRAGGSVTCDCIEGNANAGGSITCDEINGSATAKGNIYCDEIDEEDPTPEDQPADRDIQIHKDGENINIQKKGRFTITIHKD